MMKEITELKDAHKGEDIWIIASGASMNFVDPSFFEGKITIGVNYVYKKFKCMYLIRKENKGMKEAYETGFKLIVSEYDCGNLFKCKNEIKGDYYYFRHKPNKGILPVDLSVVGTDMIIVSASTITSALHIAVYMGAKNVILCGHDCGTLDGKNNFNGYLPPPAGSAGYSAWIKTIEEQTIQVKRKLREVYGCNIYSLNPFVSLNLEGHKFDG